MHVSHVDLPEFGPLPRVHRPRPAHLSDDALDSVSLQPTNEVSGLREYPVPQWVPVTASRTLGGRGCDLIGVGHEVLPGPVGVEIVVALIPDQVATDRVQDPVAPVVVGPMCR